MFNKKKVKTIETHEIASDLLKYLKKPSIYLEEATALFSDLALIDKSVKEGKKLTKKQQSILTRSSELVVLIEVSNEYYKY